MWPADEGRLEPCPRHMRPVASAAWEALVRDPGTAVQTVDLATYRALLADPTWGLVRQLLVTTRWYDKGVELALAWLAVTDRYEAVLPAPEVATGRAQLFGLLLDMLDRLDAWETYLEVWHQLRRHTAYGLTYHDGPHSAATRPRAQPYVMRRQEGQIQLHFLWLSSHRKDLIERKLATKRAGRRLGHLRHHPPDELSDAEVRRRVSAVARWARTLRRGGADPPDPDPPPGAATPPAPEDCYPIGDKAYRERVRRGIYAMFSREGDAAVAAVREEMAEGQLATPVAVREALHERMRDVDKERFGEKDDSEVCLSLTYAFEDIIPEGVTWPRGWLQHELTTYLYVSAYSDGEFLSFEHTILEATSTDEAYAAGQELLMGHETHRVNDYVIDVETMQRNRSAAGVRQPPHEASDTRGFRSD